MTHEQAINQIYKLLTNVPKLKGRKYKEYALILKRQRWEIADTVCWARAHAALHKEFPMRSRDAAKL